MIYEFLFSIHKLNGDLNTVAVSVYITLVAFALYGMYEKLKS